MSTLEYRDVQIMSLRRLFCQQIPLAILSRDELVIFHRMLEKRLNYIRRECTLSGDVSQLSLSRAVEIAKIQSKIERGLHGMADHEKSLEDIFRVTVGDEEYEQAPTTQQAV